MTISTLAKFGFKRGDYLIVAVVLLCAGLLLLGFAGKSVPQVLSVSVNEEELARYTLPFSSEISLDELLYPCTLVIDGTTVFLQDTTCPGHDCEICGAISQSGETIVCLPNRLLLTLSGGKSNVDAVTQ